MKAALPDVEIEAVVAEHAAQVKELAGAVDQMISAATVGNAHAIYYAKRRLSLASEACRDWLR